MQKYIIIIIIGLISIIGMYIVFNVDIEKEYIPESEVEEVDLRRTIITLFFKNKETGELTEENRLIDSKELLKNPYQSIIELLIEGPENEVNDKIIGENTKIIDVSFEKGIVKINFSKEFVDNIEKENLVTSKNAIYQSLIDFTEVNDVKIFVEGDELVL